MKIVIREPFSNITLWYRLLIGFGFHHSSIISHVSSSDDTFNLCWPKVIDMGDKVLDSYTFMGMG